MAGRVAKAHVTKFPVHEFSNASYIETNTPGVWNMEQHEVLNQLKEESFKRRVEILEQLLITVRRNGGRLPYSDPRAIFNGLALALSDSNWDVRLKCIQLINEVIPQFGDDLDSCMAVTLGKLISNIGESKITVRRAVIQTLHVYMKYTKHVQLLLRAIVQHGLENDDQRVRKETVVSLPMLFTPEFQRENFFEITQSLAKKLNDNSVEDNIRECALTTLDKIKNLVGDREFTGYVMKLSTPLRRYYCELTGLDMGPPVSDGYSSGPNTPRNMKPFSKASKQDNFGPPNTSRSTANYVDSFEFGIIPSQVMKQIGDQENFKLRAQGVEELKSIVRELQTSDISNSLMPNMLAFISFLNNLLDDSNFKITTVTLEILNILVEKLGQNVKQFLKPLSSTLAKRMGDNKIVVRQAVMRVAIKMMQSYQPKAVIAVIFDHIHHKNSRVRLDTVNIIIAALLTFPSYDFDLPRICQVIAPALCDGKRQVRHAALECFSVIAQAMGQGRLQPLVHAVDGVELNAEGEGVMAAVQARLARRQLPKLNHEGLVDYAINPPSSASSRASTHSQGADIDWIMAVGNSGSARHISRSDTLEIESVSSSARSTPAVTMENGTPGPSRRFKSAGLRSNFPWEDESKQIEQGSLSDGPPKPVRATWAGEDSTSEGSPPKRTPKRRITVVGLNSDDANQSDSSSYKQIHLNKLKKSYGSTGKLNTSSLGGLDLAEFDRAKASTKSPRHSDHPPVKPFLEVRATKSESSTTNHTTEDDWRAKDDESPFPQKPALARSATRRASKKVPPIATGYSERFVSSREDDSDSAYDDTLERGLQDESKSEMMKYLQKLRGGAKMMNSLKSIRSSASKKKEQIYEKHSSQHSLSSRSRSPSPELHESGIWSTVSSSNGESDVSSLSSRTNKKTKKKNEFPFESRPKLARANSFSKKKPESNGFDVSDLSQNGNSVIHIDYNPSSGVTFRENKTSDVQVVGRGYNEEPGIDSSRQNGQPAANRIRDRRRVQKGPLLSPLGVASMHSYGALEWDDDRAPTQDSIGVIGKGMFDSSSGVEHAITAGNSQSNDRHDRKPPKSDRKDFTSGVVGVSINRQGSNDEPGLENTDDIENDPTKPMSRSTKERLLRAQKIKEEEAEFQRIEREKKRQEHDEKLRKERERQQEKLRRLNTSESIPISTPKKSPSMSPRKKPSMQLAMNGSSSHPPSAATTPMESDNPADWQPFKDPEGALRDAHRNLQSEEWETKCSGLNTLRRLAMHNPDTLIAQLHPVILALLNEVKNLRSQVSRLAIVTLGDLFNNLRKAMDSDVEITAKALLAKNGESNGFIREDVEKTLQALVDNVSLQRTLLALIAGGATHKNVQVRKTTSHFVVEVVERMGPGKILSGVKDITDRVLPTAAHFAIDSSQETRYNGRKILTLLMSHPDFDKMLSKHLPANTLRNIKDIVENLKAKGLGEMPHESSSARGGRGPASRSSSTVRGGSANSELHPSPSKRFVRADEATQEEIKQMMTLISANDWRDRYKGITHLLEMCESNTEIVMVNVIKIFDKFLPRLQDPNSKVNLYALQVMLQIIPILSDSLASVLNIAVGNIAPNLSSKNREIYSTAMDIITQLTIHIDGSLLLQPLANQAQSASARSKPDLVEKVAELVTKVYVRKQKQVTLHVLPLLWHLLGATNSSGAVQGSSSSIRVATGSLVNALYSQMGQSLLDKATGDPNVTPRHLQLLNEMIDR